MSRSVTEQILWKFPEILGELSMREQCVPGSFFSAHAQEPGNKATALIERQLIKVLSANGVFTNEGSPLSCCLTIIITLLMVFNEVKQ